MKRFLIILIAAILCGCATTAGTGKKTKEEIAEEKRELFVIYETKEDLEGYTQEQILEKLGEPYSSEESFVHDNRITVWHYKDIYYDIKITFVNGIAYEIEYH